MPYKPIDRRPSPQGPDYNLPAHTTYFLLGCGACEHSISLKVRGDARAEELEAELGDISPLWVTRQGLTHAKAPAERCPENPALCSQADRLEEADELVEALIRGETVETVKV